MKRLNAALSVFIALLLLAFACPAAIAAAAEGQLGTVTFHTDLTVGDYTRQDALLALNSESEGFDFSTISDALQAALESCSTSIPLQEYNIPVDQIQALADYIGNEMPEAFHVGRSFSYRARSGYIIELCNITYRYEPEEYAQMLAVFRQNADWLLRGLSAASLTDVEKALLIHDRIITWTFYGYCGDDTQDSFCFTAAGPLLMHEGVCSGYAHLYDYLLKKVGIASRYVSSDSMNHAWNIVSINGQWYHVDTTWDDGGWTDVAGRASHENFLRSTAGIVDTGHTGNDFTTVPVSTTYDNAYWQNSIAEFAWFQNALYYIDSTNGGLYKRSGGSAQKLLELKDSWGGWAINRSSDSQSGTYYRYFYGLSENSKYLYYSTPSQVLQLSLPDLTAVPVYTPSIASGSYLFGSTVRDWELTAQIGNNPTSITQTQTVPLPHDYTVAYNANGGSGAPAEQTKRADQPLTLSSAEPTLAHHTFLGWNTAADGSGEDYAPGAVITANADLTLYAQWRLYFCTIRFYGNGATSGPAAADQTLNYGETAELAPNPYQRAYTVTYDYNGATGGYETACETVSSLFNGWAETPNGEAAYGDGQGVRNMIDEDEALVDFYACWSPGSVSLPTPTKAGFVFDGWYEDGGFTQLAGMGGAAYTPTQDGTLFAAWRREPPVISPAAGGVLINNANRCIYGLRPGSTAEASLKVNNGSLAVVFSNTNQVLGTGTKVNVLDADQNLVDSYTVVVFGDIDGDGWYDGTDAYFIRLYTNGMLPANALNAAQLMACDANHDDVIDAADAKLVERAGLLLAGVDQSANNEDLAVNSDYQAYCSLIDQSAAAEEEAKPAAQSLWSRIAAVWKTILKWLSAVFSAA